jgi:glycosyltransferase involved in cell wall biosynthesis
MSTIWLDISLIKERRGLPPVGISRVELACCQYFFEEKNKSIRFCYYSPYSGKFHEIKNDRVKDIIEAQFNYKNDIKKQFKDTQTLKILVRQIIFRLPTSMQEPVFDIYRAGRSFLKYCLSNFKVKKPIFSYGYAGKKIVFQPKDVYVSVGIDWNKDIPYLYQLKKQYNLKVVAFCHDIIPIVLPHLAYDHARKVFPKYWMDLAWVADKIICNSEATRQDLNNFFIKVDAPIPCLERVRLGCEIKISQQPQPLSDAVQELIDSPYILYVSTIERRKNHDILYKAYTRLVEKGMTLPKLIFVGGPGWLVKDLIHDLSFDPRIQGLIVILHHINDNELSALYQHAMFTVYPSLYEGWGLPVDEGLVHGKFCLASNTSSLPEVGGDLIEYLDPLDLIQWVTRLEYYMTHPDELKKREQIIAAQYKPHSWRDTGAFIFDHAIMLANEKNGDPQ